MEASPEPRVVLVHDWLTGMRGGEKCLEALCRRWPDAALYTLLHRKGSVAPAIEQLRPRTSWLQWLPGIFRHYRYFLPLMPAAVATWRLPPCDLVVSFSHCVAKAALPPLRKDEVRRMKDESETSLDSSFILHPSSFPRVPHVCYCFTPMRYAWHMREAYFGGRVRGLKARLVAALLERLRRWDRQTSERVSHFIAISQTVQRRIRECYDRASTVIYPPVDTDFYHPDDRPRDDHYLIVSAFAPYKRLDLAIAACNRLRRPLMIIGTGQDEARLRSLAGPTVQFLGWQPDEVIREQLRRCRALLFPGEEDFGIVPLEAHACGAPVIALGRGGATETVVPPESGREPTGLWFTEATADGLADGLVRFEATRGHFDPAVARRQALRFNGQRFAQELFAYLDSVLRGSQAATRRAA